MKLAFLFVGGHKEEWLTELAAEYQKKLGFFCPTEIIRIRPSKQSRASAEQKLAEETQDLLRAIKKDDILVVCDEKGDSVSSLKFSQKLVKLFERGRPRVVILIGGSFGFGSEIRERADWTWSLSPLTFNHHIAQAVVLEQTYRAFAIWKNLPYHNE
jgi:23S rRNA (pseudouridine1915-N3)-methyltransferase